MTLGSSSKKVKNKQKKKLALPKKNKKLSSRSRHFTEKRGAKRRPLLEEFSCFVVLENEGHRLSARDLSESGIGFDLGSILSDHRASGVRKPLQLGDQRGIRFYLNQSFFIPLQIKIVRISESDAGSPFVGAEFSNKNTAEYQAYLAFVRLLDKIGDILQNDSAL